MAWGKSEHGPSLYNEIGMFRRVGLSDMKTILLELSRDPAMIFWLDNNENHKDEINENYGRELLELFSMGVGNYTEDDIKAASRAFTGWTFTQPLSLYPVGHHNAEFTFDPDDHDYDEKTFLGQTGNFDGEDIIDISLGSRRRRGSSRVTCTTSSWRTRFRCLRGRLSRRATRLRYRRWRTPS